MVGGRAASEGEGEEGEEHEDEQADQEDAGAGGAALGLGADAQGRGRERAVAFEPRAAGAAGSLSAVFLLPHELVLKSRQRGGVDGAGLADVIDQMANQVEALTDLFAQTEAGRMRTDESLARLAGSIQLLTENLGSGAGSNAVLERIADGQDKLLAIIQKNAAEPAIDGGDAEARMRLRSIDVQLLKILEEVAAGRQEAVAELRSDLAQLTRAVRSLVRIEPSAPLRKD